MNRTFWVLLSVLMPAAVWSQSQTHSPYSQYGVGDPVREGFVNAFSMGGVNRYLSDEFIMNPYNPATYSNLRSTTYDVGLFYSQTKASGSDFVRETDDAGLRYFGMGFPISDRVGWGMGMVPYSEMGYDFFSTYPAGNSTARSQYSGLGGISKVYAGLGVEVIKDSLNRLSLGGNFLYMFGPMERVTRVTFTDAQSTKFNSLVSEEARISDVNFDAGIHYKRDITALLTKKKNNRIYLNVGASAMPQTGLNTRRTQSAISISGQPKDEVRSVRDTVDYMIPLEYGAGASVEIYNMNKKNRLIIGFNYESVEWSSLTLGGRNQDLSDAHVYSAGFQYSPDESAIRGLLKLMQYRGGVRYAQTRLNIDGQQLADYGISAGFSLPLLKSKSVTTMSTTLNLGMEYGVRGSSAEMTEEYTRFMLGISLTPNFWDKWFERRKIE